MGAIQRAVAAGEVIVDRDEVDAPAGQRVQVDGQGGDEGLAFAGAHLGDLAAVQDDAADELDIVVALVDGALGGFTHDGEGLGQELVQIRPSPPRPHLLRVERGCRDGHGTRPFWRAEPRR